LVQESEPDSIVGANAGLSLRQAQRNVAVFGACDEVNARDTRKPGPDDLRDPQWKPVDQWDPDEWRDLYERILRSRRL
jgi:hypothetical protein